ncbi:conserved hypothetical protein [Verticillium alfalfae VaMs.102]|uniref:Dpy-30 domain-containing protein n=1 Tax=Verticillium alfalfae (strain VaMs.102 / ATCC MYA-4576 / FGSC 10136) TaxID=526221 RepID=C9SLX5_VERA1|nr:conserved hypothetical protein [Verticillium alfalfae VaMs.102]EEY19790.1 conserved hypothetical protein [Verticillium alfalfae VaMs.102]
MSDTLNAADTPQISADQPVVDAPAPTPAHVFASVDVPDDGTKIAIEEPVAARELAPTSSTDPTSTLETAAATADVLMPDAPTGDNAPEPGSSRAGSVHPDPGFTMPDKAASHGDPVRQYLNNNVTTVLLDGMKQIAKDKPKDPLRVLGNYLIQRSKELEQTDN